MATSSLTFTNGGTSNQPFGTFSGVKVIDNFSSTDLPYSPVDTAANHTDPYQGIAFYKIGLVYMTVGGTSGTANAARMGLWKSANTVFDYAAFTLNGTAATVSSATTNANVTVNAVIANATTYYMGTWATASLAAKRDTATGSFSMYSGNTISTTVATTYNPGNLQFGIRYTYLPNAPTGVTIVSKTSTSVTISWTAPSDPGGYAASTLRYKVQWTSASGFTNSQAISETAAGATSATVTGLTPGETYQFYVAAMNDVIPTGVNSYTSLDSSIYIDSYSSGPFSTASTATQLPGGIYDGTAWKPLKYQKIRVFKLKPTTFTNGVVYAFTNMASLDITSATQPVVPGDIITVSGVGTPSGFNGTFTVYSVSNFSSTWTVNFYSNYYNSSSSDLNTSPTSGTVYAANYANLKVYNGSSWVTII